MQRKNTGIFFDIKRFAIHDGPGIRTSVFFKGCPLHCDWCHNPESQILKIQEGDIYKFGQTYSIKQIINEVVKDRIFYNESGGGVTFTGGEPLIQISVLKELASKIKKLGIHIALDTCGYTSKKNIREIMGKIDLFLYDIKLINDEKHQKYTGVSNKLIMENLSYLDRQNQEILLRIPIIPSINDSLQDLNDFHHFFSSLTKQYPIHILPYHDIGRYKYSLLNKIYTIPEIKKSIINTAINVVKSFFREHQYTVKIGG